MNKNNSVNALLTLQVVIILLKLASVEPMNSWSWLWATAFTWIPFSLGIIGMAGAKLLKK